MPNSALSILVDRIYKAIPNDCSKSDMQTAVRYLRRFGYISEDESKVSTISSAISEARKIAGLSSETLVDSQFIKAVTTAPRCGFPDHVPFAASHPRWSKELDEVFWTWDQDKYLTTANLSKTRQKDIAQQAWDQISEHGNVKFTYTSSKSKANITIAASVDPRYGLGTPSNTLAVAWLPHNDRFAGKLDMLVDNSERWIELGSNLSGVVLLAVLCHEGLHTAGYTHSNVRTALLAPFYSSTIWKPQANDDIPRILKVYGPPAAPQPSPVPQPAPTPSPVPQSDEYLIRIRGKLEELKINGKTVMIV